MNGSCISVVQIPDTGDVRTDPTVCLDCVLPDCENNSDCGANQFCDKANTSCACVEGSHVCGDSCPLDDDPAFCGAGCVDCPTAMFGERTCVDGSCGVDCFDGFFFCETCGPGCVECVTNEQCPSELPVCASDNTCTFCEGNSDCDDDAICSEDGACVRCTERNSTLCDGNSCDPLTNTCTQTRLRSRDTCEPCVSDTECVSDHRCVAMQFAGANLPGGWCLPEEEGGCAQPLPILVQKRSLSSPSVDTYCGLREDSISCQAYVDYGQPCRRDRNEDCGLENFDDGQCRRMSGIDRCTYDCVDDFDCQGGTICVNGLYCLDI